MTRTYAVVRRAGVVLAFEDSRDEALRDLYAKCHAVAYVTATSVQDARAKGDELLREAGL